MIGSSMTRGAVGVCGILLGMALAACGEEPTPPALHEHPAFARGGEPGPTSTAQNQALAELRRVTARFHDFATAQAAGYTVLFDPDAAGAGSACLSDPTRGAMGEHYVNPAYLLDGGALDVSRPEALIYEPQKNGEYRLVGIEYVVLFSDVPQSAAPPVLLEEAFMANDNPGFHLWGLHAWVWQNNPSGLYAPWNPKVTCAFSSN